MSRYEWSWLTTAQVGRYGEYFVKMEFTMYGFDVYTSEVDDRGIDFVVRKDAEHYYDIQVKTIRSLNYMYIEKRKFQIARNRYVALVLLCDGAGPELYLLPTDRWRTPDRLFVDRNLRGAEKRAGMGIATISIKAADAEEVRLRYECPGAVTLRLSAVPANFSLRLYRVPLASLPGSSGPRLRMMWANT